ncbi:hypothetical protein I7I48_02225 [Histoplasma ohiense]|nr:hypothetical protein I7I48_02225 [Histoplasma ohiense (nom. inval.)]
MTPDTNMSKTAKRNRFDSSTPVIKQSNQQSISQQHYQPNPHLMSSNPALTHVPCSLTAFHHRPKPRRTARMSSAQCARFRRTRCSPTPAICGRATAATRIRQKLTRSRIHPILPHPLPILLVQLRPLGTELQTPIASFHTPNAPRRRRHACHCFSM